MQKRYEILLERVMKGNTSNSTGNTDTVVINPTYNELVQNPKKL